MPDPQYLFVYGTLRRGCRHEMHHWLATHARFVGEAAIGGRLFLVQHFPGVTLSNDPTHVVRGELFELTEPARILPRLDEYESYDPTDPQQSLYLRELMKVQLGDGRRFDAWVYIYNRPTEGLTVIESGDFLDTRKRE